MSKCWEYKHVSKYLEMLKKVKAYFELNPYGKVTLYRFGCELDQEEFKKEFMKALDIRINLKGGLCQESRKYSDQYQTELMRDASAIREWSTKKYICHYLGTKELKRRYSHILRKD